MKWLTGLRRRPAGMAEMGSPVAQHPLTRRAAAAAKDTLKRRKQELFTKRSEARRHPCIRRKHQWNTRDEVAYGVTAAAGGHGGNGLSRRSAPAHTPRGGRRERHTEKKKTRTIHKTKRSTAASVHTQKTPVEHTR